MRSPRNIWLGIAAALTVLDIWAARNQLQGDSLSECTRELFRTDTPAGRAALVGAWAALTAWLIPHLLRTNTKEQ